MQLVALARTLARIGTQTYVQSLKRRDQTRSSVCPRTPARTHLRTRAHTHAHTCTHTHTHTCVRVCARAHTRMRTHTCTHAHTLTVTVPHAYTHRSMRTSSRSHCSLRSSRQVVPFPLGILSASSFPLARGPVQLVIAPMPSAFPFTLTRSPSYALHRGLTVPLTATLGMHSRARVPARSSARQRSLCVRSRCRRST